MLTAAQVKIAVVKPQCAKSRSLTVCFVCSQIYLFIDDPDSENTDYVVIALCMCLAKKF